MKHKICIDVDAGFGLKMKDEIPVLAEIGFDGCFTTWQVGSDIPKTARLIADCGLIYQSIHSPFRGIDVVWEEGKAGDDFIKMLVDCVRDCASGDVPIAVVHPIIGMDKHTPTSLGIERFGRLLDEAQKCGVTVAFENVEGFEYLELIKDIAYFMPQCVSTEERPIFSWDQPPKKLLPGCICERSNSTAIVCRRSSVTACLLPYKTP